MSKGYYRGMGIAIDYSGNCQPFPKETKEELESYRKEKLALLDDFLIGRKKLKGEERKRFKEALSNIKSMRGIDNYFKTYLDTHM